MNCHQLRVRLKEKPNKVKERRKTIFRQGSRMIKCEKCGNYFPLEQTECHHSVITFHEIKKEIDRKTLSIQDARSLMRDDDNIMIVCSKCHKKLHKTHYHN